MRMAQNANEMMRDRQNIEKKGSTHASIPGRFKQAPKED
jgi:hypothetical protein